MANITLHRRQALGLALPYWVCINQQPVGVMQTKEVSLRLPPGAYELTIKIVMPLLKWRFELSGSSFVAIGEDEDVHLCITDNERWWNLLFNIDLILWVAEFFFTLPHPWGLVYEVASNGFFVMWLARLWWIRRRYFKLVKS